MYFASIQEKITLLGLPFLSTKADLNEADPISVQDDNNSANFQLNKSSLSLYCPQIRPVDGPIRVTRPGNTCCTFGPTKPSLASYQERKWNSVGFRVSSAECIGKLLMLNKFQMEIPDGLTFTFDFFSSFITLNAGYFECYWTVKVRDFAWYVHRLECNGNDWEMSV